MVARARELGYGTRDPSQASVDSPERFGAFSVPVHHGESVIACLSCAWLPQVSSEREMVGAYLPALQDAARAIGERVRRSGLPAAPGTAPAEAAPG
jgi:DNA-binding IclR family transcriptional regulator